MMLTSTPIKEKAALKAGLLDGVVPKEQLLEAARRLALEIAAGTKPRNLSLYRYRGDLFSEYNQLWLAGCRICIPLW